ncbi:MAG: hypothetical protein ACOCW3_05250 [Spirochaetota bacterium]
MKVVELTDVVQQETPLHYRRAFTATAHLDCGRSEPEPARLEFVLEQSPFGAVDVRVTLLDDLDYPLVPAIAAIKSHIRQLHERGELS